MIRVAWLTVVCMAVGLVSATETLPWFGNIMEFEFRTTYSYEHYAHVTECDAFGDYSSNDQLLNLSLALSPVSQWNGEVELLVAHTRAQGFQVAHLRATGRYLWLDDVVGDPISLTTGLSLTVPVKTSQQDISLGYHGDVEVEGHVAIGREITCCDTWLARAWVVGFAGIANIGSPWAGGEFAVEGNLCDTHRFRAFARGRCGFGDECLDVTQDPFQSYARIGHRNVDVGARYTYVMCCGSQLSVEYFQRIYSHNYPDNVHAIGVCYFWPFSL